MSRKGLWVHCMCGCGYTGRVVEEAAGELSVKNCDEVRIYPSSKVADGAWCELCANKPARVLLVATLPHVYGNQEAEEAMCWECFSTAGNAARLRAVTIKTVKALDENSQEREDDVATEY